MLHRNRTSRLVLSRYSHHRTIVQWRGTSHSPVVVSGSVWREGIAMTDSLPPKARRLSAAWLNTRAAGLAPLIALVLTCARAQNLLDAHPLCWLGRVSYSLMHVPAMLVIVHATGPGLPTWAVQVVLATSFVVAHLLWHELRTEAAPSAGRVVRRFVEPTVPRPGCLGWRPSRRESARARAPTRRRPRSRGARQVRRPCPFLVRARGWRAMARRRS